MTLKAPSRPERVPGACCVVPIIFDEARVTQLDVELLIYLRPPKVDQEDIASFQQKLKSCPLPLSASHQLRGIHEYSSLKFARASLPYLKKT